MIPALRIRSQGESFHSTSQFSNRSNTPFSEQNNAVSSLVDTPRQQNYAQDSAEENEERLDDWEKISLTKSNINPQEKEHELEEVNNSDAVPQRPYKNNKSAQRKRIQEGAEKLRREAKEDPLLRVALGYIESPKDQSNNSAAKTVNKENEVRQKPAKPKSHSSNITNRNFSVRKKIRVPSRRDRDQDGSSEVDMSSYDSSDDDSADEYVYKFQQKKEKNYDNAFLKKEND
ncbi:MAG: hypothetical protein LBB29_02120, partial [Holosporaceae bacterium]|nr:hypothetical protein [Holosporaceae bacterium]